MSKNILQDLRECIDELLKCDAFELQVHIDENGQTNYYLPYMMNDALECYFVLKDCQMTGAYEAGNLNSANTSKFGGFADFAGQSDVELIESEGGYALIIRQTDGNVATLWFKDFQKELKCYRYHEIGHFWVKGQEQWRQLVYIIGTIYDKFEYMGESICNNTELALLPLMEFAPFRYWSPIHEALDGYYPDTMDGIICFKELCMAAKDGKLLKMVRRYEKAFQKISKLSGFAWLSNLYEKFILTRIVRTVTTELSKSGHESLYELIYKRVCDASSKYPARDYGEVMNAKIESVRRDASHVLASKSFVGQYPRFSKGNISVLVTEEHPFTLSALEYENYEFRLQLMVSETPEKACFLNQGFFDGTGNRGWIVKSVDGL